MQSEFYPAACVSARGQLLECSEAHSPRAAPAHEGDSPGTLLESAGAAAGPQLSAFVADQRLPRARAASRAALHALPGQGSHASTRLDAFQCESHRSLRLERAALEVLAEVQCRVQRWKGAVVLHILLQQVVSAFLLLAARMAARRARRKPLMAGVATGLAGAEDASCKL
mmetsp:Transcript_116998/g.277911  ORF Transcript_116998/g.277911 Transcript_116998/m.277911 type:complete len:170 (-) Transcript_116998:203-712(-)|eukprot:CAMPEP_0181446866 /NCGR_PEP_ID=MMETSP1110-20121109/26329_1 /TAXON_ID=174948 /ORGANISM="Symbiodinium sp., Strain CCMP421" /LENGTH=169 /DNA_ID=CAMNT_0023570965 /DNA_START=448 /DNA_END=957 /DNA_ORIENTATION=-